MMETQDETARSNKRTAGLKHEPKLNWDQVNQIRRTYAFRSSTHGTTALATHFGVSANTIHKIVRGKMWKVHTGDGNVVPPLQHKVTARAFSAALVRQDNDMRLLAAMVHQCATRTS